MGLSLRFFYFNESQKESVAGLDRMMSSLNNILAYYIPAAGVKNTIERKLLFSCF